MEYFLGVDIGTTSVKTIAFSSAGKALYEETISYPTAHPFPDRSEQNPEQIAGAVFKTVENMLQLISPSIPVSIGFSSAMHSLIAVDRNGMPYHPVSSGQITAQHRSLKIFINKISPVKSIN